MPRPSKPARLANDPGEADGARGEEQLFRFLRFGHIFASVLNEVLEAKLLKEISTCPLTVSQFHLLKLMTTNGKHQVGHVADFLGVSAPAATKNIDKLEGLGLVVRAPFKGDRRATLLSVSPKGRRLVQKFEERKTARLAPVLGRFRAEEVAQLSQLLERFTVSLLKSEDSIEGFCLRCAAYLDSACPVGELRGGCPYQKGRAAGSARPAVRENS